jgi:hypothetical protein
MLSFMKTNLISSTRASALPRWAGAATGLLVGAACLVAQAQGPSPVGNWDLVSSGAQRGIVFLTFSNDYSFSGYEITTYLPDTSQSSDPRGGGEASRQPDMGSGASSNQFFFGYTPLAGWWNFDAKGNLIGNYLEHGGLADQSQGVSFTGKVKPGRSLVLKTTDSPDPTQISTKPRHSTLRGVPFTVARNVGGSWSGSGEITGISTTNGASSKQTFFDFFSLTNISALAVTDTNLVAGMEVLTELAASPFAANTYWLTGMGPGYTNFGLAFLSVQKQLSIVSRQYSIANSNTTLRATAGSMSNSKRNNRLVGTADDNTHFVYKVRQY